MNAMRFTRRAALRGSMTALALITSATAAYAQDSVIGEVVVTAQKRSEQLLDIPMSVSVLGGESLERAQADNFQDLVALVPGLSINTSTRGISRITLRGVNTGGVASTVGVYVNDVPFGSSSGLANGAILSGDFDTFDMARIEVLRGPQGTLYGASSLGGVIKYVANDPSTEAFEARMQGSFEDVNGGDMGYAATGMLNIPVSETFALRATGFYRSDDGYVDSIGNNPIPTLQDPDVNIVDGTRVEENINSLETLGGRLSALFAPSDSFSLNLAAVYQEINSDNSDQFEVDPVTLEPLYGGEVASRYHPEFTDIEYQIFSATIDWDVGPLTVQSVTSYGEFTETFQRDAALTPIDDGLPGTAQLATLLFSTPGTTDQLLSSTLNQITSTEKFTQELRLVSPESDRFEWLVGAYYTDEDSGIDPQQIFAVEAGTETLAAVVPGALVEASLVSKYEELAMFANATWHITDRFDLSFGGRWSENDQEASQVVTGVLLGGEVVEFSGLESSESPFTYSVSPRFEFSDTTAVYARLATGFRPGGPNVLPPGVPDDVPPTYDSDELTSYEIGLKTGTADGSFMFDVAAYYLDWEDIQLLAVVNGFGVNDNGGTAVSKGLEFTATTRIANGLNLTFSGAYIDAYLTEDTDPLVGGLDGDPLSWVPELSLGLGVDYEWAVFADSTAYVGGQVAYASERPADFDTRDDDGNIVEADSYTTVDLRTGLLMDNWSVELYAKNVTDEEVINDITAPGTIAAGAAGVAMNRPRTIGMSLGYRF